MGIKTSTFSGWRLSGKTADAFLAELYSNEPNKKAKKTLRLGDKLMKQYKEKGYVTLKSRVTQIGQMVYCQQNRYSI